MITHPGPPTTEHRNQPAAKRRKTDMKVPVVDTSSALGVIDPESDIEGKIAVLDGEPYDAMLVLIDPARNIDKFFVLQLIECESGMHAVYTRWGRTGTTGQGLEQEFEEFEDALQCFEDKFEEKTGLAWEHRQDPPLGGSSKYRFIQQNFQAKQEGYVGAKWQYWVDDGVDGKVPGWYDYTPAGSMQVEQLYHENAINPRLTDRIVHSGHWTYAVNLAQMTQTNVQHYNRTSRRIRRVAVPSSVQDVKMEEEDSEDEDGEEEEYVPAAEDDDEEDTGDEEPMTKVTDAAVDDKTEKEEKKKSPKQREFILTVTADVSGRASEATTDDITFAQFGNDYDDGGEPTSLRECLQAEETSFRRACGEIVASYIIDNAKECFETITNLDAFDGQDKVELNGPARVDRNTGKVSFPFREVVPSDMEDSETLRGNMLSEIESGGDTWACGDFGDIGRDGVNLNDWDYWVGNGRRCRVEMPLDDGRVEIRMYLGVDPDIVEKI